MPWRYDPVIATYSDDDGRTLSQEQMRDVRNAMADGFEEEAAALVLLWFAGKITLEQWAQAFAGLVAAGITAAYVLGYGGTMMLDAAADARIYELIAAQYAYLTGFAEDIYAALRAGVPMSEAMMAARSGLYAGSMVEAYEQANAEAHGAMLPYWPADGGTPCMQRCRCWWAYEQGDGVTNAYWHTQEDPGVCEGCLNREAESDPFVLVPKIDPGRRDARYRLEPLSDRRTPILKTSSDWSVTAPQAKG